jgi:hypothetical protein
MNYSPDRWIILKITTPVQTIYKVLAGWWGGYLGSDRWRLNSGIKSSTFKDGMFYFHGLTESVYICHQESYGMTGLMMSVYNSMRETIEEQGEDMSLELIDENDPFFSTVDGYGSQV